MTEIAENDCLEAWRSSCSLLIREREIFNLVIRIESPTTLDQTWLSQYDPRTQGTDFDRLRDVINTVFPYRLWNMCPNRANLYRRYLRDYRRGKRLSRNRGAWGTYFQRLTDYHLDGRINQLESVIEKLRTWNVRSTAGLVFHPSNPALDAPRKRGAPCWHYGEILWHANDRIDLFVVYRNHDYANKAFGNFLALGKLLEFIAGESGKQAGALICHSAHAYYACGKDRLRNLARL